MTYSVREKRLLFGVAAVLTLLALDYYALTPLSEREDVLNQQREQIRLDNRRAQEIFAERKKLEPAWKRMVSEGLKTDRAAAEGQLLHAVRDWAKENGLLLTSVKPEWPESKEALRQIYVQASATGGMDGISRFLWRLQSARFPLKIVEMQLSSRTDGVNDLALQIKLSTLYNTPEQKPKRDKTNGGAR